MDELNDIRICALPDMRVLVSLIQNGNGEPIDDMGVGMGAWADAHDVISHPGMRETFAYFDMRYNTFVMLRRIPQGFVNDGPYPDIEIKGGLEAVVCGERDHLVDRHKSLEEWIKQSERYELDPRHDAMVDWLTPQDVHIKYDFEQQDIFVPIRLK